MTRINVITGGQTGADRGAWLAARAARFQVGGFAPADMRDENGPIPSLIASTLEPCPNDGGYRERTILNVEISEVVICVVQNAARTPSGGTGLTWESADRIKRPRLLVDPNTKQCDVVNFLQRGGAQLVMWRDDAFRIMIAGPRASRWSDAADLAARVVRWIAEAYPQPVVTRRVTVAQRV